MATIVTRSGKGSPLTNTEVDSNFTNLNTDKLENITGESIGDLSDVTISTASSGQVLQYNGTAWVNSSTSGIGNIVEDTTPQLGGDLDSNGNDITFGDNDKAIFGAGSDLQIYHDAFNSIINENGTGNLKIQNAGIDVVEVSSSGIDVTGSVTVSGTVDGRDVATDGTKLDGIEAGATADQTAQEIATAIDADAIAEATLKSALGLGTAAYTASTAYATAAQGALADSALQSGDNISTLTNDSGYLTSYTETNDLTAAVTWTNIPDANVPQTAVTQHQAALSITESQISDLGSYLTSNQLITLSGDASGSGTTSIAVTVADDSHNHSSSSGSFAVGGDLTASGKIGKDSTDYITFTDNTQMDVYVNGVNTARFESDGDFHATADIVAYSTTPSDIRLKENINVIDNALNKVKALTGYTFTYKNSGKESAGIIAQELESVLPQAVTDKEMPLIADDGVEYKTVNYDALHAVLIEAVKELTKRVEELEGK